MNNTPSTETLRVADITVDQLGARRTAIEDQLHDLLAQERLARKQAFDAHYAKALTLLGDNNIPACIQQLQICATHIEYQEEAA
jgi:hypothetical protein